MVVSGWPATGLFSESFRFCPVFFPRGLPAGLRGLSENVPNFTGNLCLLTSAGFRGPSGNIKIFTRNLCFFFLRCAPAPRRQKKHWFHVKIFMFLERPRRRPGGRTTNVSGKIQDVFGKSPVTCGKAPREGKQEKIRKFLETVL